MALPESLPGQEINSLFNESFWVKQEPKIFLRFLQA